MILLAEESESSLGGILKEALLPAGWDIGGVHITPGVISACVVAVLLLLTAIACWSSLYTRMLPLHGGGRNLLGGFFLLDFAFGMVFYRFRKIFENWKISGAAFLFFVLLYAILSKILNFDAGGSYYTIWLSANPPGVFYTSYVFAVFFGFLFCRTGLDFLRTHGRWKRTGDFIARLLFLLALCGRYSYVIFLFHMIPLLLLQKLGFPPDNSPGRGLLIILGILVPPVFSILLGWIGRKARLFLSPQAE